jgi:apolipoprotein N-acyltransferase
MAGRLAVLPFGYILASLAAACIARIMPTTRIEATTTGMLLGFGVYAAILMWAFSARSVLRLWLWLSGAAVLTTAFLAIAIASGGRA